MFQSIQSFVFSASHCPPFFVFDLSAAIEGIPSARAKSRFAVAVEVSGLALDLFRKKTLTEYDNKIYKVWYKVSIKVYK